MFGSIRQYGKRQHEHSYPPVNPATQKKVRFVKVHISRGGISPNPLKPATNFLKV